MQSSYRFTPSPDRLLDPTKAPLASPAFTGTVSVPVGTAASPAIAFTGDADTGVFHPAADTASVAVGGAERLRVAPTLVSLGGAPGAESLRAVPVTNAVNWVQTTGSIAGGGFVTVGGTGADADVGIRLSTKGNGSITFDATGNRQFRVAGVAGATSWVEVVGSTAGVPQIAANAASGDVTLALYGKANGGIRVESLSGRIGFFGTTPQTRPTVTGSRSGGTALQSLLAALSTLGLIADGTSA